MTIWEALPTKKVTAFVLGAALTWIVFWFVVDVFGLIAEWPAPAVLSAFVVFGGFVLAWVVPESAWGKVQSHMDEA